MCGLTGILSSASSENIFEKLTDMNACLAHRGPDDEKVWTENGIGLAHRRLAILDLSSSGAQPMHSSCGRYVQHTMAKYIIIINFEEISKKKVFHLHGEDNLILKLCLPLLFIGD